MAPIDHKPESAADRRDQLIAIRKDDIVEALIATDAFAADAEREQFRCLCGMLASIFHYRYFAVLERLRRDYYYFSPDFEPHAGVDRKLIERCYADLILSVDRVLREANFVELPHGDIADAHRRRTVLRVEVKAPLDDFREVRFYRRGRHTESFDVLEWFGLRSRKIDAEVYDDVVILVAMKSEAEIGSQREIRALRRHKLRPGSVLLKCFRNIAVTDLQALYPNVRVVMSLMDKLILGVPAIAGSIPILLNLYATITVLFLVIGFYLGMSASVADKDMKTALAALSGLVALGAFVARQWVKYQRQSLKYRTELADNIYYRNINNNAGIFDFIVGAAEDQECKEALLAYHFLRIAPSPVNSEELEGRIEAWLQARFGSGFRFKVEEALAALQKFGVLCQEGGGRLSVLPLCRAVARLHAVWNDLLPQPSVGASAPTEVPSPQA